MTEETWPDREYAITVDNVEITSIGSHCERLLYADRCVAIHDGIGPHIDISDGTIKNDSEHIYRPH